jgi:hypothetical protein
MADRPFFEILEHERLIPASELSQWLGRIVKFHFEPNASYTPIDPSPFVIYPLSLTEIHDVTSVVTAAKGMSLEGAIGESLTAASSTSSGGHIDFTTRRILSVRLQRYDKIFQALRDSPEIKQDLKDMLAPGGRPAFMIVGALIWSDATFASVRSIESQLSASATAPLTAAVAAGTAVPLPNIDPKLKTSRDHSTSRMLEGLSLGSHIFGIQYKAIRRPILAFGRNFKPIMVDVGPRVEGSIKYSGSVGAEARVMTESEDAIYQMDEDFVDWTEVLDEEDGEIESLEVDDIGLVFAKPLN